MIKESFERKLSKETIASLAKELLDAETQLKPIKPITERFPEITNADAYAIQLEIVKAKEHLGQSVVGKKIGLTSKPMRDLAGVYEPDYGHILDQLMVLEDEEIDLAQLIQPRFEVEIAFILKEDLTGPTVNTAQVLKATEGVMAAIEIIDSRIENWKIKIQDTIADNASIGRIILGGKLVPIKDIDLRLIGMVSKKNGEIVSCSASAAVLGNPAQAVAWLANKISNYGLSLKPGEIVMSGSFAAAVPVNQDDHVTAEFDKLGSVSTRFK